MIMIDNEENRARMREIGPRVLNITDGMIYRDELVTDEEDRPVGFRFPFNIRTDEYIEVPTINPYLRKQYLQTLSYTWWDMAQYGITIDICPDKFIYCFNPVDDFFARMYSHQVSLLLQEKDVPEAKGFPSAEIAFFQYAREATPALLREWCQEKGIELIQE